MHPIAADPGMMRTVDVRGALERWARWRDGGRVAFAQMRSLTGRLLDGMKSTTCPDCKGEGRLPGHRVGSQMKWIDPCPRCLGRKRIKGDLKAERSTYSEWCEECFDPTQGRSTGEVKGRTCIPCRGAGRRTHVRLEVNPAGISGTRHYGANEDPDPQSMMIDRLIASWSQTGATIFLYRVIVAEYCGFDPVTGRSCQGTQEAKAACLGANQPWFSKNLKEAHRRVEDLLKTVF